MRGARIAMPGDLYGSSVSAQTFDTIGGSIVNPSDVDEISDANVSMEGAR